MVSTELANVGAGTVLVGRYLLTESAEPPPQGGVTVWHANDEVLDRPVRVTLLTGEHAPPTLDAARKAALVTDARIARVLDVGTTPLADSTAEGDEISYLVHEPLPGLSLAEVVKRHPLTEHQTRAVVGEVALALDAADRRGVRHQQLRPEEVRLVGDRVLLTGLGTSHALRAGGRHVGDEVGAAVDALSLVALARFATTGRWDDLTELPHVTEEGLRAAGPLGPLYTEPVPHTPGEVARRLGTWNVAHDLEGVVHQTPLPLDGGRAGSRGVPVRNSVRSDRMVSGKRRPHPGRIPRKSAKVGEIHALQHAQEAATDPGGTPVVVGSTAVAAPGPRATQVPTIVAAPVSPGVPPPARRMAPVAPLPIRRQRGINPTPIVLLLALFGVGAGALWAVGNVVDMFATDASTVATDDRPTADEIAADETASTEEVGAEEHPPEEPGAAQEPEVRPVIVTVTSVDGERAETAHLAIDGDPNTFWYSFTYQTSNFGGLKSGLGLHLQLAEAAPVGSMTIVTTGSGGNVQIRATTAEDPTGGELLAEGPLAGGSSEFAFTEPVTTDQFVLWFTELPTLPDGRFRLEVQEIIPH